jgi:hypothetical protein
MGDVRRFNAIMLVSVKATEERDEREGWLKVSDWLSTVIAGVALLVSVLTAAGTYLQSRRRLRTAELTAYFYWNQARARVDLPDRRIYVGYNLVIWNQGPAPALNVDLEVRRPAGQIVRLASVEDGELPLARIDSAGKYPLQFAPDLDEFFEADNHPIVRRFDIRLRWTDGNGRHEKLVPLRRGQLGR